MARDERFPDEIGMDRRAFVKAAVGIGAVGLTGSLVASGASLIPPVLQPEGEVNEGFVYARADTPNPFGFDEFIGQNARTEHFTETWAGVATLWRALFNEVGEQIPATGFPVLLIKVDPSLLRVPAEWTGDHYFADEGIVAIYDRCVHLCCFPQWHIDKLPPAYQDYEAARVPRTFLAGEDPIWCRCHNSQYDPVTLVWDVHPNGTLYVGANMAHGPATRGMPAVSIEDSGGEILGRRFAAAPPEAPADVVTRLRGNRAAVFRDWYFAYCR
ncbi:MAG TPA: hypothetical protein VJ400_08385 [Thermoplasmata archaeon]|nr:hypothetical protein [Thermoplasmata archaeon]